jgi:hypothetical protein
MHKIDQKSTREWLFNSMNLLRIFMKLMEKSSEITLWMEDFDAVVLGTMTKLSLQSMMHSIPWDCTWSDSNQSANLGDSKITIFAHAIVNFDPGFSWASVLESSKDIPFYNIGSLTGLLPSTLTPKCQTYDCGIRFSIDNQFCHLMFR